MVQYIFAPEKIRKRREHMGLSINELGIAAGIDGAAISRIERRKRNPGADIIARLAGALNVAPGYFFTHKIVIKEVPGNQ